MSDSHIEAAFRFLDLDNNKVITYKEFTTLLEFNNFDKFVFENYLNDSIDSVKLNSNEYIFWNQPNNSHKRQVIHSKQKISNSQFKNR